MEKARFGDAALKTTDTPSLTLFTASGTYDAQNGYSHFLVLTGSLGRGSPGPACPAGASAGAPPTGTATPLAPDPGQEGDSMPFKGALVFKAKLEDGANDTKNSTTTNCSGGGPAPADAVSLKFLSGSIEAAVLKPQNGLGFALNLAPRSSYVEELEIAFDPGASLAPWIQLRTGQRSVHININTRQEFLNLGSWDQTAATSAEIGPRVPIPGLQSGRVIKLAAAVDGNRYIVFLDGKKVIDERTDAAGTAATNLSFSVLGCNGGSGTMRISGARIYNLAPGNDSR
jgi:hypothetical protein